MIDDELVARPSRARPLARPSRHPRHGPEPRRLLPGARSRATRSTSPAPTIVQNAMDKFAALAGRQYHLFDYVGAPDAERVIVIMGSGAEVGAGDGRCPARRAARRSACSRSACTGRSPSRAFVAALPATVEAIAVLDRTKEPGATGEPLYLDVVTALAEAGIADTKVIGGRYGLSSKEFTPAMVKGVFDELRKPHAEEPLHRRHQRRRHPHQPRLRSRLLHRRAPAPCARCSTASARMAPSAPTRTPSRSSARRPTTYAQGYFVYDSKKSGAMTTSHLRFGPQADPLQLPDHRGQLRRLPPVLVPGAHRRAEVRRARRHLPAQQPLRPGRGLGHSCRARCSSRSSTRS